MSPRLLTGMSFGIAVMVLPPVALSAEVMTGDELEELYSKDVTECGTYPANDNRVAYCELWRSDGVVIGQSDVAYEGSYRIKSNEAVVCVQFGSLPEHCGPYIQKSPEIFSVVYADGNRGDVRIVDGDPLNLSQP